MSKATNVTLLFSGRLKTTANLLKAANEAFNCRDWSTAAGHFRQALNRRPKAFSVWVQLGHALKEMGDIEGAASAYRTAENLDPADVDLKVQLGHFNKVTGNLDRALEYYKAAVALGSQDIHALTFILASGASPANHQAAKEIRAKGDVARDSGDLRSALKFYRQSVQVSDQDADAFVQLGNCQKDLRRYQAAEQSYRKALALRPADADCYLQLGHLMKLTGNTERAIESYAKSNELDSIRPDAAEELRVLQQASSARGDLYRPRPVMHQPEHGSATLSASVATLLSRYRDVSQHRRK